MRPTAIGKMDDACVCVCVCVCRERNRVKARDGGRVGRGDRGGKRGRRGFKCEVYQHYNQYKLCAHYLSHDIRKILVRFRSYQSNIHM